jgi:hypothetical protein
MHSIAEVAECLEITLGPGQPAISPGIVPSTQGQVAASLCLESLSG